MKTSHALPLLASVLMIGCTTTQTQQRVLAEPMSYDLEAQVMRETGISGSITGSVIGGLGGFAVGFTTAVISGADPATAAIIGAGTGAAGAIGGGMYGYERGKREGQRIVQSALGRDASSRLLAGAKVYNKRLADSNQKIRNEIARLKKMDNAALRQRQAASVEKEAGRELKDASQRLAQRQKAIESGRIDSSNASAYKTAAQALAKNVEDLSDLQRAAQLLAQSN